MARMESKATAVRVDAATHRRLWALAELVGESLTGVVRVLSHSNIDGVLAAGAAQARARLAAAEAAAEASREKGARA